MFSIEEVRKNNRTGLLVSSFVAHFAAMALVLIMVLGPSTAMARRLSNPENFCVTAQTAYTVTVITGPVDGVVVSKRVLVVAWACPDACPPSSLA